MNSRVYSLICFALWFADSRSESKKISKRSRLRFVCGEVNTSKTRSKSCVHAGTKQVITSVVLIRSTQAYY